MMSIQENGNRPTLLAAIADLHIGSHNGFPKSNEQKDAFEKTAKLVHAVAICGDFTENGLIIEAEEVAEFLSVISVPIVGVIGNRERKKGNQRKITDILSKKGRVFMLDGNTHSVAVHQGTIYERTITFTGTEGSWQFGKPGETVIFENPPDEKLNQGIQLLGNGTNIVLLHHPPIWDTGISEEWAHRFPHRSSQLEEQLDNSNRRIHSVFHGHTHDAPSEGKTKGGITVLNVALPVNRALHNGNGHDPTHLFRIVEV